MEIPDLPDSTILMVEVGSTAHGTGIEGGEDHDQLAIVVEDPEHVLGLDERGFKTVMQRTQPEGERSGPGDIDRTLHSLRRFIRLAASGNPSILMTFWAPVEYGTELGDELRALSSAFIGRHIITRYRGYLESQARSASGDGKPGRPELVEKYGFDTKYAMHAARLGYQCLELLDTGRLELPLQGEVGDWLRSVRSGKVSFEQWRSRVLELDALLAARETTDDVPPGPDRDAIDAWSIAAHQRVWTQGVGKGYWLEGNGP